MQLPDYFDFFCPVKTGSGNRALEHLPSDLAALDARKPLVITEKRNREKGLVKHLIQAFKTSKITIGIYDGIDDTTGMDTVQKLHALYNDRGFDSIIAVGNGNVMNVAKILNIAVSGKPEDVASAADDGRVKGPLKPLVYIPVVSGNCTETSTDASIGRLFVSSKYLAPDIVTIDPRMLLDEDPEKVVNTAMAALTYGIEAYMDPEANPFTLTYAQLVVDFIINNLMDLIRESFISKGLIKGAIWEYKAKKERRALVNAAVMAGYVHADTKRGLASTTGLLLADYCDIPAGIAMGLLLPFTMESAVKRDGLDLGKIMRPMAGIELFCCTPEGQRFDYVINRIRCIQNELFSLTSCRIPRTLADVRVSEKTLNDIAERVAEQGFDKPVCLMILNHAFEGNPVTG